MTQAFALRCTALLVRNRLHCTRCSSSSKAFLSRTRRCLRDRPPAYVGHSSRLCTASYHASDILPPSTQLHTGHSIATHANSFHEDTIFALSSGAGVTAGVAIIRVSGPHALHCLRHLLGTSAPKIPRPRYAAVRKLYDPHTAELLDEAVVLFFPGPRSFTGEDVVELHVHGSRAVINGVIEALGKVQVDATLRPAERGEFTRRAFENGRMDLTGVEGLADLIAAETSMQRKQALRQLSGDVREMLESWREEIKTCLAHAEAVIDFGDDVDDDAFEAIVPRVHALCEEIKGHLSDGHRGEIVRGGARVVIVGEPNAGKSTLLNSLARRPAAIVSPKAGTTRDIVEVQLDLNGLAVIVCDTAGLRDETDDPIEMEGMRRARSAASKADVTILVHDGTNGDLQDVVAALPTRLDVDGGRGIDGEATGDSLFCVINKVDLLADSHISVPNLPVPIFKTSLLRNEGVSELISHLEKVLRRRVEGHGNEHSQRLGKGSDVPVITRARHRHHMTSAADALTAFLDGRTGPDSSLYLPMDLAAEELRIAGNELGSITGIIHAEEVLDVIFSEFCIGK